MPKHKPEPSHKPLRSMGLNLTIVGFIRDGDKIRAIATFGYERFIMDYDQAIETLSQSRLTPADVARCPRIENQTVSRVSFEWTGNPAYSDGGT